MSLVRGKYGIEYNPRQLERNSSSGLGWVFVAVAVVASISLAWTLVVRFRSREPVVVAEEPSSAVPPPAPSAPEPYAAPAPPPVAAESLGRRPAKLRNLLMRLEVAERERKLEMAVTTIEQIRSLPGAPAADIDDRLARRLGELNMKRLFEEHCAQWVKTVRVKGGDQAVRIARENGSTFASLVLLNEGCDVSRLKVGQALRVMDHPRFRLVVDRVSLTADLFLNGKFFCRYDLVAPVGCPNGQYEMPDRPRSFWKKSGLKFRRVAEAELEQLLPPGTPVVVRAAEGAEEAE